MSKVATLVLSLSAASIVGFLGSFLISAFWAPSSPLLISQETVHQNSDLFLVSKDLSLENRSSRKVEVMGISRLGCAVVSASNDPPLSLNPGEKKTVRVAFKVKSRAEEINIPIAVITDRPKILYSSVDFDPLITSVGPTLAPTIAPETSSETN